MSRDRALAGLIAVTLVLTAIPATIHSTAARSANTRDVDAQKHANAPKACKPDKSRGERKMCKVAAKTRTAPPQEHPSTPAAKGAFEIVWTPELAFEELTYTLNCGPASGTLADPQAACAEIAKYPAMVVQEPSEYIGSGPCCSSALTVSGEYNGRAVDLEYASGRANHYATNWEHFLPTNRQENEVGLDHAIGPFALGSNRSSIEALLAQGPAETTGGLYVYEPWSFRTSTCGATSDGEPNQVLAIRYGREGRVVTVIADQNMLAIEGREVWSLLVRCAPGGAEDVSYSQGPLRSWTAVTCGGLEGFADHLLGEGSKARATTIVVPEGEADQFSFVIVTSKPRSACGDIARLHGEAEALRAAYGWTKHEEEEGKPLTPEERNDREKLRSEAEKARSEAREKDDGALPRGG